VPKHPTLPIAGGTATLALNGGAVPATATLEGRTAKAADCEPLPPTALSIVSVDPCCSGRAITTPGMCWLSSAREWLVNFEGFQIAAPAFTGGGQYVLPGRSSLSPLSPFATVFVPAAGGHSADFHTAAFDGGGSFTVAPGMQSGTVSATLGDTRYESPFYQPQPFPARAKPVTVSGEWSCVQAPHNLSPPLVFR
jgi:hypothetical protein